MAQLPKPVSKLLRQKTCATIIAFIICNALPSYAADSARTTATELSLLTTEQLADLSSSICVSGEVTSESMRPVINLDLTLQNEPIHFRQTEIGTTVTVTLKDTGQQILEIQFLQPPGRPSQTNITSYTASARSANTTDRKPDTRLSLTDDCNIRTAHKVVYNSAGQSPLYVTALDASLRPTGDKQWLNPELPELSKTDPDAIRVALIDSGVNYLLPEIANGLATDTQGALSGYDFWDMDNKPFDANPARSPFFVQRHGTRTASIVLRQAPGVRLVPYRYPRNNMTRMIELIEHANALGIKVIGMPLGSNTYADWTDFESAAKRHPHMLFIVSAGNNGRDIDQSAVYPAAMDLKNMLVVTSADDFIHPAERTNFGRLSVDYLVPAEQIDALDFNGEVINVSGSSYAVARVVALASRLLQQNPDHTATDLMSTIRGMSIRAETSRFVSVGYLGDPLASIDLSDLHFTINDNNEFESDANTQTGYFMPLQLVKLDSRWDDTILKVAINNANRLYSQCNITLEVESIVTLSGPDYLKDLSPGNALTLSRALTSQKAQQGTTRTTLAEESATRVFLARDTIMLEQYDANAFGIGNTRNRPWMTNSLWLTHGITDTDIALAHELFHIATNSGDHSALDGNLMQDRTNPQNTHLTKEQCTSAVETGLANGVLLRRK